MADATVNETGANSQTAEAATPTAEAQNAVATPPVAENATANPGSENRVPQQRFNEVIAERNEIREREQRIRQEYESKIRDLEARQPRHDGAAEALTKRLVDKLGMTPEAAAEVVAVQREAARLERGDIDNKLRQYEVTSWSEQLAKKHKDYQELLPQMEKVFVNMSDQEQMHVMASPAAMERFYKAVRADALDKQLQDKFNAGANAAYENKAAKVAVSSLPGASTGNQPSALSREVIAKMSIPEYTKRKDEINAWLEKRSR